jgi:hypothetical protein
MKLIRRIGKEIQQSILRSLLTAVVERLRPHIGYELILDHTGKAVSITCIECGKTSTRAADIKLKYCKHCKKFHK